MPLVKDPEREERLRRRRLELRSPLGVPNIWTDTTFLAGRRGDDGFGLDDHARKRAYAKARQQGISPTGKIWSPQLNTWISGKGDVKRLCEQRGLGCEGVVNVKAREPDNPPEDKPYKVADDIVDNEVDRIVQEERGPVTPKQRHKLVEETRENLSGTPD